MYKTVFPLALNYFNEIENQVLSLLIMFEIDSSRFGEFDDSRFSIVLFYDK